MSKSAKENWFSSPLAKNNFWFIHQQKTDLFSFSKSINNQKTIYLTPSHNSKPIQIQKIRNSPSIYQLQLSQTSSNRFDDVNLPDMYCNTKIQKQVINEKINFQDSQVIEQEQDFITPQRNPHDSDSSYNKSKKYQAGTTAKKSSNFHTVQQKKTRPKQKGLRMLSQKAYQIVLRTNGATYKEVANLLVEELALEDTIDIDEKDQQNIKRRVYDALNVLIALGVLRKDGRKIAGVLQNEGYLEQLKLEGKDLFDSIFLKNQILKEKRMRLQNLRQNALLLKALARRNKAKFAKKQKIQFPFIGSFINNIDPNSINFTKGHIEVFSKDQIHPFGDIDVVSHLKNVLKVYTA